jgi:hypothetical protein
MITAQEQLCTLGVYYAPYIPKNMNKSKYQFGRKKWYEGKFDWRKYDEVHDWCEQNFGKHDKRPDAWSRWNHMYEDMILFRDEKDYIMFVLRWGA